jgi:small-conductance mechanosensitive channel
MKRSECAKEGLILLFDAFGKLSKFPLLAVIPVVVDGLSLMLGVAMHGFHGNPHFTLKLTLQMGLPSISAVTEQGFMPGSVQIAGVGGINTSGVIGILFYLALILVVQSFLQGGYVGLLHEATHGRRLSLERFAAYGRHFLWRFLLLDILVLAFLFVLGGLATAILRMPGVIVFMLIFLLLRVLFLFLEFTLVADDCSISEAFSRSRDAFRRRTPDTIPLVGAALVINVVAGLLVNALWLPFFFLVLLLVYDIVGSGLQLAFMHDYRRIRG